MITKILLLLFEKTSDHSPRNSSGGSKSAKNSVSTISVLNQHTSDTTDFQQRRRQSSVLLRKSLRHSEHSPYSVWPRRSSDAHRLMPSNPMANEIARRSQKIRSTGESSDHD